MLILTLFLGAIRIYVYTYSIYTLLHIILALKVRLAISKAKLYFEKNAFLFSLRQHGPTKEKPYQPIERVYVTFSFQL